MTLLTIEWQKVVQLRIFLCYVLSSILAACGTVATELGNRTNSTINRQEHHSVDIERAKIIYTSDNCEGNVRKSESSKCARLPDEKATNDKDPADG